MTDQSTPTASTERGQAAVTPSRGLLVLLTLLVAFGALSTDMYLPSLPAIAEHLRAAPADAQLTLSGFLAGFAIMQLFYGPLSDGFGRKPVLLVGLVVYMIAGWVCAVAPNIEFLIGARVAQGIGACSGAVIGRAMVRDIYGRERAAQMYGYIASAMAMGPLVAPMVGGQVEHYFGWRGNFVALGLFGTVMLLLVLAALPESLPTRDPRAMRPRQMLVNMRALLASPIFRGHTAVVCFAFGGLFAWISGSSFVMVDGFGVTPRMFGIFFAITVSGYALGSFTGGRLTHRGRPLTLITLGVSMMLASGLAVVTITALGQSSPALVALSVAVAMGGAGFALPQAMAGAVGPFPETAGTASALMGFSQMTVGATVAVINGWIYDGTPLGLGILIGANGALALVAALSLRHHRGH